MFPLPFPEHVGIVSEVPGMSLPKKAMIYLLLDFWQIVSADRYRGKKHN